MDWVNRVGRTLQASGLDEALQSTSEVNRPNGLLMARTANVASLSLKSRPLVRRIKPTVSRAASRGVLHRVIKNRYSVVIPATQNFPTPQRVDPVRTGEVLIFPNSSAGLGLYASLHPAGVSASVIIRTEEVGGTLRTTGGSATISVSGLPLLSDTEIAELRQSWSEALARVGHGRRNWRFAPLNVRSMSAAIELPNSQYISRPRVTTDADTVSAVFLLEFTASGAQEWRQAIERNDPQTISGSISLDQTFATSNDNKLSTQSRQMTASLGAILAAAIPDMRIVKAEVDVEARLVVRGHPTVDTIAIDLHGGDSVQTEILDSDGGEIALSLSTTDTSNAQFRWNARVSFSPPSWPVVAVNGGLNKETGWVDILAPATWVRSIEIISAFVDETGAVAESSGDNDGEPDLIMGSVDLDAEFVDGAPIHNSFELKNQEIVTVRLPDPPAAQPGQIVLSILSKRGNVQNLQSRAIASNEHWVIVKVFPDARVDFATNRSLATESARSSGLPVALDKLTGQCQSKLA